MNKICSKNFICASILAIAVAVLSYGSLSTNTVEHVNAAENTEVTAGSVNFLAKRAAASLGISDNAVVAGSDTVAVGVSRSSADDDSFSDGKAVSYLQAVHISEKETAVQETAAADIQAAQEKIKTEEEARLKAEAEAKAKAEAEAKKKAEEEAKAKEAAKAKEQAQAAQAATQAQAAQQTQAVAASVDDQTLLAALIQCEAGGECYDGQVAVGAVVVNRLHSGYAGSIHDVIYQRSQFGPAASGKVASVAASGPSASCVQAAAAALAGSDPTGGARNFCRAGKRDGTVIGNHVFY